MSTTKNAPYEVESAIPINDRYTLFITPVSKDDSGRVRVHVRIAMKPRREGDPPINVLSKTTIALVPGEKVNLGGLRLSDGGDLIVVLWVDR